MKITVAKRNSVEEVHKAGCRDLKNRSGRGWASDREDWTLEVTTLEDLYREYWDCIADEQLGEGQYDTLEQVWWAWRSEFVVKPCASDLPEMPEPGSVKPAKPSRSEAKADLARRMILAVSEVLKSADGSECFRAGMTEDEARQIAANWMAHLPAGRDGDKPWWPESLPEPTAKRWG